MKISAKKLKDLIGFKPHICQQQVLAEMKRFNILNAGRRFGKTLLVSYIVLREMLLPEKKIWVVAPTYNLTERVWNYLMKYVKCFPQELFHIEKARMRITCLPTGSVLECKSSDNPESLLGEGLDLVVFDEASKERSEKIWDQYLRPTLLDRKGKAVFISTPTGKNWFWKLWYEAEGDTDWAKWSFTSYDNPYNDPEELDKIKLKTPRLIWLQEWLGQFIDGAGLVFSEIKGCIMGEIMEQAHEGSETDAFRYIIGWDPGKMQDFSAVTVLDRATRGVVHFDRFNQISWTDQKKRVRGIADKFGRGKIIVDASGGRDTLVEDLQNGGYAALGIQYTAKMKRELINNLAVKMENWDLTFPKIDILIEELENFSRFVTPAGNVRYEAPSGFHDDCVNSLALAAWDLKDIRYEPMKRTGRGSKSYVKVY